MSAIKELKEGDVRAWGLLISLILMALALVLPWHTSYNLLTMENDKTTYVANAFGIHFTHGYGSSTVADKTFSYSALGAETGFDEPYAQYVSFLLPALLLLVILMFAYELWKGDLVDRRGVFQIFGLILLLSIITMFVGLWSEFLKYEFGMGFWASSSAIYTVKSSTPDWGFWCLLAAFGLSLITLIWGLKRETLKLLLPKFRRR